MENQTVARSGFSPVASGLEKPLLAGYDNNNINNNHNRNNDNDDTINHQERIFSLDTTKAFSKAQPYSIVLFSIILIVILNRTL